MITVTHRRTSWRRWWPWM